VPPKAKTPKAAEVEVSLESTNPDVPKPRLKSLSIRNFRCIGPQPVKIELDEIVVLVGPNNAGKSTILRAYEVAMSQGSDKGKLTSEDFPYNKIDPTQPVEIILETIVFDNQPGAEWIKTDPQTQEMVITEKWTWSAPGAPKRQGLKAATSDWDDTVPWGAPGVANSRRPEPHRVDAFASPEVQTSEIIKLLRTALVDRVKNLPPGPDGEENEYQKLLKSIGSLQKTIVAQTADEITKFEKNLSDLISEVFPHYVVEFDARSEDDLDKALSLFKTDPTLRMGEKGGYHAPVDKQGSGARRTLLWTALRLLAEDKRVRSKKSDEVSKRPHLLLIDEPEICLHPGAIREASRVLYDLTKSSSNWQVMVTTHSPVFVDFSRDNTCIIRVERSSTGEVSSTTVFRPSRAKLSAVEKENLKMLNLCDPYVAEFFFGGRTIIVEGDTEYSAFNYIISQEVDKYRNVHIIRARGKVTIALLIKVLSLFGASFSILHDSDRPTIYTKKGVLRKNGAWTNNLTILTAFKNAPDPNKLKLCSCVPNFEEACLGYEADDDKPFNALKRIKEDAKSLQNVKTLLDFLLGSPGATPPANIIQWNVIEELEKTLNKFESVDTN